ncbi:MAG: NAD-dependent epimerase/dehydratase family protein [Anaerolineales bacterium]
MHLLILGGTVFLGRHIVEAALQRGHTLTLFNRGQHHPELFPQVEKLRGDRRTEGGLDALKGRKWDAVIDTCGYIPREVRASAQLLAGAVERYTFISTESVYADFRTVDIDESHPTGALADETVEEVTGETYGPLKALCERAAESALPGRTLTIRPGLIVGPHDPTDRFTYWPARMARGGEVLAPARPDYPVQFIDVRDLADWIVRLTETRATGVFNADGLPNASGGYAVGELRSSSPHASFAGAVTLGALLDASRAESKSDARVMWVSESFLLEHKVAPWSELPLWIPEADGDAVGFAAISVQKALSTGLTLRSLVETVSDTLAWAATRPTDHSWRAGLTPEREAELLRFWNQRSNV